MTYARYAAELQYRVHREQVQLDYLRRATEHRTKEALAGRRTKRTHLPTQLEREQLPVHSKPVRPCDLDAILQLAVGTPYETRFRELLRVLHDGNFYGEVAVVEGPDLFADKRSGLPRAIDALLQHQIIRRLRPGEKLVRTGKLFEVVEEKATGERRLRIIFWPMQLNDEFWARFEKDMHLSDVFDRCAEVHAGDAAACFDLTCSFFQFALAEEVQLYYGFVAPDGTEYAFTRMVMGGVPSAEVCDVALKILAYTQRDVVTTTHIDNVRFVGTKEEVAAAAKEFRRRCDQCRVTLNDEPENEVHSAGKFLGIHFDYSAKTVALSPKTRHKLQQWMLELDRLTLGDIASLFGQLMWASSVTGFNIADVYHSVKFFRRRLSLLHRNPDAENMPTTVWPCIRSQLEQWLLALAVSPPRTPNTYCEVPQVTLFTDASLTGWGGVLFDHHTGEWREVGGKWKYDGRHINQLEMEAVRQVVEAFLPRLVGRHVHLLVDNTSVQSVIVHGRSQSFWLNERFRAVADLTQHFASLRVDYVPSKANLADALSRGERLVFPPQQLASPSGSGAFRQRDARLAGSTVPG